MYSNMYVRDGVFWLMCTYVFHSMNFMCRCVE